jgi:acyl-CoA thioesterase-1
MDGPLVVFLGDSLTAGYGLREEEAYPALLAARLRTEGKPVKVVNAGISGDTTAGGLARLDWLLSQNPDVVVVELGANDGLRGLSLEETGQNLDGIIRRCLQAGAKVLLLGMQIPPSYGVEYSGGFATLFGELAESHRITLMPFLLEGVAADPKLNQADGIHPNAVGHRRLAVGVQPYLEEVLEGL